MPDSDMDSDLLKKLGDMLRTTRVSRPVTIMEVCGTHTVSIRQAGIQELLPNGVRLISGPGCPVCVTPPSFLDTALEMGRRHAVTLVTFGDMMNVPGGGGSLLEYRSQGGDVALVYSPSSLLDLARRSPDTQFVFLAVGFETTAPTVAAVIKQVRQERLSNVSFLSAHKLVAPVLKLLIDDDHLAVDGFLLPGHVSVVLGERPYRFISDVCRRAGVITGFEPEDIIQGILMLIRQINDGTPAIENQYSRAVRPDGNPTALRLIDDVFDAVDTQWRGFGVIPASGLQLKSEYADVDARLRFPVSDVKSEDPKGCRCGDVLRGLIDPPTCPLFGQTCTPEHPVGACMVSSEGTCAAWYRHAPATATSGSAKKQ